MKNILKIGSLLFAFCLLALAGSTEAKVGVSCLSNTACGTGEVCLGPDALSRTTGTCIMYARMTPTKTSDMKVIMKALVASRGDTSLSKIPTKININKNFSYIDEKTRQPVVMASMTGLYKDYGVEYGTSLSTMKRTSLRTTNRESNAPINAFLDSSLVSAPLSNIISGSVYYYRFYGTTTDGKTISTTPACLKINTDKTLDNNLKCPGQVIGKIAPIKYITSKTALNTQVSGLNIIGN